jgi:hypothetical protein
LDWQPTEGAHGLAVTLNYNRIDILNRITDTDEFFYNPGVFFNSPGAVTRGSVGQITQITFLPINLGLRHSRSLDAGADYSIDTRFGRLTFGFSGTYTIELEDVAISGRNLTNAAYPFFNDPYLPWDPRRVDLRGRIFYLEVTSRNSDLFH